MVVTVPPDAELARGLAADLGTATFVLGAGAECRACGLAGALLVEGTVPLDAGGGFGAAAAGGLVGEGREGLRAGMSGAGTGALLGDVAAPDGALRPSPRKVAALAAGPAAVATGSADPGADVCAALGLPPCTPASPAARCTGALTASAGGFGGRLAPLRPEEAGLVLAPPLRPLASGTCLLGCAGDAAAARGGCAGAFALLGRPDASIWPAYAVVL